MNKIVASGWTCALVLLSGVAAQAIPVAPAPEASTNVGLGLVLALGVGVALIARKKSAKHSA